MALLRARATRVARVRHGTVDITHRIKVLPKDFQNSLSVTRYSKFFKSMIWKSPRPLQFVTEMKAVNRMGTAENRANSR